MKRENQKKNKILKRIAVISAAAAILAVSMAGAVVCGFFDRMHTGTTEDADTLQQTEETTDPLQLMTEVVKQKEAGADGGKSTFTILEIVPDTTYAMIGYLISGKEPIGTFGMDALSNSITGSTNGRYTTYLTTPHIGNAGDVRAVVRSWGTYTGYFEKVTSGEGLYAISTSESTEYDYLPVTAGDGEFKATIKYYVPKDDRPTEDTWEHVLLKYTVNNYDISFKNQTTQTSNTVYYKVDTVTENKGSGYYSFDDTEQIYVYDTTGKSDYDVTFVTTDWNTSGVKNYVVDAISYNPKEGAYCAYIDPDQWIEKTAAVTDTTDYNYQYAISNICMVSKLCKDNFSNTGNFDYVWHDDNSLSLECTTESDFEDGGNIYLYDYLKSKTINNEMFKLFCLAIDGADGENGIHT
ncbi:MAG TPA: hypothetical protein PLU43_02420, partial [Lachnospiraceae bacterium]|nr:hypothetical protein [Lachnospiraceae bacterium]